MIAHAVFDHDVDRMCHVVFARGDHSKPTVLFSQSRRDTRAIWKPRNIPQPPCYKTGRTDPTARWIMLFAYAVGLIKTDGRRDEPFSVRVREVARRGRGGVLDTRSGVHPAE